MLFNNCTRLRAFSAWLPPGVLKRVSKPLPNLLQVCVVLQEQKDLHSIFRNCPNLRDLWLRRKPDQNTPKECISELKRIRQSLRNLRSLFISRIDIRLEEIIPSLVGLEHLTHLELLYANLTDTNLQEIADSVPQLKVLGLCGNMHITTNGLYHITKRIKGLQKLDIMATKMDSEFATCQMIARTDVFPNLQILYILHWQLEWRVQLQNSKENCQIIDYQQWRKRHGLDNDRINSH